jgi:hypothetical protein
MGEGRAGLPGGKGESTARMGLYRLCRQTFPLLPLICVNQCNLWTCCFLRFFPTAYDLPLPFLLLAWFKSGLHHQGSVVRSDAVRRFRQCPYGHTTNQDAHLGNPDLNHARNRLTATPRTARNRGITIILEFPLTKVKFMLIWLLILARCARVFSFREAVRCLSFCVEVETVHL